MRSLTTAQKRELTSPASIKLIVTGSNFNYISSPDTGSYAYYEPYLDLDNWNQECDWLGGMSAISDTEIVIKNPELASTDLFSNAYENEEVTISILLNDSTLHTIYKGVINDWSIDQEEWSLDITDETFKYDVDILTEVTVENYPDAPEESFGLYLPLFYSLLTTKKMPVVNVRKTHPKLIIANHELSGGTSPEQVWIYNSSIETYIKVINPESDTMTFTSPGSYEFYGADGFLSEYRKYTVSRASAGLTDLEHIGDGDDATYVDIDANELVSIILDMTDLGYIEANTDVDCVVEVDNVVNTPQVAIYNVTSSTYYGGTNLSDGTNTFTPDGPDNGGSLWTFSDLQNYEWAVRCQAGESLDLIDIYFDITFKLYSFQPINPSKRGPGYLPGNPKEGKI